MSSFEPNKRHLRALLIFFFNLEKSAAEALRFLVETYDEAALNETSYRFRFQKFKNGEFNIEDKDRSRRPKVYKNAELEALSLSLLLMKNGASMIIVSVQQAD